MLKKLKIGSKKWFVLAVIVALFTAIFNGLTIYLIRFLLEYGQAGEMNKLFEVAKWMMIFASVSLIVELFKSWVNAKYQEKSMLLMKKTYIEQLFKQDVTQLQKERTTQYLSNLTNDFDRYEQKFIVNLLNLVDMASNFLISLVLLVSVSPLLLIVVAVILVVFLTFSMKTGKTVQKTEEVKSKSLQRYVDVVNETLLGFEIIKQHQLEKVRGALFAKHANEVQDDNYKVDVKTTQVEGLNQLAQTVVIYALVVGGILAAKQFDLSIGGILVVTASIGNVMWPMSEFPPTITAMRGIENILEDFDKNLQRPVMNRPEHVNHFNSLVFNQSNLGYDSVILDHVDIQINAQDKVLILGPSGAGKSTILKTIRQTVAPLRGKVTLNDIDISTIDSDDYFSLFTTVDQIGFVFNGTLHDNVTLYQSIDEDYVKSCLQTVGLGELDSSFKCQNNGANLSGGQRARIILARALCLNGDVIVCDEIFANLDAEIAYDIEKDLLSLPKTIINVSHIMFKENLHKYDKIYVVDHGKVKIAENLEEVYSRMLDYQEHVLPQETVQA